MDRDSVRLAGERDWGHKGFRISLPPKSMKECAAAAALDAIVLGAWAYVGTGPAFKGAVPFWYLLFALAGTGAAYYLHRAMLIRNHRSTGHTRVDKGILIVRQIIACAGIMSLWFRW